MNRNELLRMIDTTLVEGDMAYLQDTVTLSDVLDGKVTKMDGKRLYHLMDRLEHDAYHINRTEHPTVFASYCIVVNELIDVMYYIKAVVSEGRIHAQKPNLNYTRDLIMDERLSDKERYDEATVMIDRLSSRWLSEYCDAQWDTV